MIRPLLALLSLTLLISSTGAETPLVKADQQFYTKGRYSAWAGPWYAQFIDTSLKRGIHYADTINVLPSTFPSGSTIAWRWPPTPPTKAGVYGYIALAFGNYDGGSPQVAVTPRQVRNVKTFRQEFDWSYSSPAGEWNLLTEFYLTSAAGKADAKVMEIGFILHTPPSSSSFINSGKQIGTYTDRYRRAWQVSMHSMDFGSYVTIAPVDRADVLIGTIDMKEVLDFLRGNRLISGKEWVNGLGFGVEPITGSGSAKVNRWAVVFK